MAEENNINILQWNILGLKSKAHHIRAAAEVEKVDVFILQETLLKDPEYYLPGFQTFLLPQVEGRQGLATLVRNTIPAIRLINSPDCGDTNEVLGVKITTRGNNNILIYNIYRHQRGIFMAEDLFSTAQYEHVIITGDFNAHHPRINLNLGKTNEAGSHIMRLLDQMPEITLVNEPEPTHVRGGTLDLTLVSTDLYPNLRWEVHSTLTSDHFAITLQVGLRTPEQVLIPPPRWNLKKINWKRFQEELDKWSETYLVPNDINVAERDLDKAFHNAADKSCPAGKHSTRTYKDHWFYDEEVKELYARINAARKLFRRNRNEDNRELLQAAVRSTDSKIRTIRKNKWLEWCSLLNEHTTLNGLWTQIHRVSGKYRKKSAESPNTSTRG